MADISSNPVVDWAGMLANAKLTNAQAGTAGATTALTQEQAKAASLQNQITTAKMPLIMSALQDAGNQSDDSGSQSASPPPKTEDSSPADNSGVQSPETGWWNPAQTDAGLRQQFFVPPITPQEAKYQQQVALSGDPGLIAQAKMKQDQRVQAQTAQSQKNSANLYDGMDAVATAPAGSAMTALAAVAPQTVARIKKMIPGAADEDAAARAYAAHVAASAHMYTGRPVEARADGQYVDAVSKNPVAGVEKSALSTEQATTLANRGNEMVPMPDGQGHSIMVHRYVAEGSKDLNSWIIKQAAAGGVLGAQSSIGGAPKAASVAAAQAGATAAQKNQPKTGPQATGYVPGNPDLSKALQDDSYRFEGANTPKNGTRSPDEQKQYDQYVENSQNLKKDTDQATKAAGNSLTFMKAAQDLLDSKGATTGKWAGVIAQAGRYVPGGIDATTNYEELAKDLGNAAVEQAKTSFPHMTEHELDMQLNNFSPSVSMTDQATRDLLKNNIAQAQYVVDSGKRARLYLGVRNDPTDFYKWNEEHFPRSKAVLGADAKSPPAAAATTPASGALPWSDAKIQAYAKAHFNGDDAKARAYLATQVKK